jgi:hypothetical protein
MGNKEQDITKIKSVEMKCLRSAKGCAKMDTIRNDEIRRELE